MMVKKWKQYVIGGRSGAVFVVLIALSMLAVGFVMASDLDRRAASSDQGTDKAYGLSADVQAAPFSFAQLADKLAPTVVNIKVTKVEKASFDSPRMPQGPFEDFFKRFFEEMPQPREKFPTQGAGSGVIISEDGYILSNNHVVEGAKELTVTMFDNREYQARIVGRDSKTDLAVLKIDAKESLPSATMGDSDDLKVGEWVMAIGNPYGLSHTVTSGIVSAKGRVIGAGPYDDFIQTDASINPGNSGGPLFNLWGEMVGINTAILPYGRGIGFAIPVNTAKPLIPQLVNTGKVTRGYLGVSIQSITPELAKAMDLDDRDGALVGDVVVGSPAERAGIKRGDVIVSFNEEEIRDARGLSATVAQTPVGDEATLTVIRDGEELNLPVKVGRLDSGDAELEASPKPAQGKWGLVLQDMTPNMAEKLGLKDAQGVVVVDVAPESPADEAGLQRGDVILEVNRHPVESVEDTKEVITKAEGDDLLLLVNRDEGSFFVVLEG